MEDEYLTVVRKGYGEGKKGRRGIDSLTAAFGTLINLMEETRKDIIGDLFEGGITYGEAGQFLTPEQVLIDVATPDGQGTGLTRTLAVKCENLYTLPQATVLRTIGRLSPAIIQRVDDALKASLALP